MGQILVYPVYWGGGSGHMFVLLHYIYMRGIFGKYKNVSLINI